VKTLKQLVKPGTDKDIASNLAKSAAQMKRIAEAIPINPANDFVGFAAQRILQYIAAEATAAQTALRKDIKLFAWRTRNILEGFLLLKHSVSSPKNAEIFLAQRIGDEQTILEGILGLAHEASGDATPIKDRVAKCKAVLAKHGFSKASPWRVDQLADAVGMKEDYAAFYKLYSKYVHPSSWVIIATSEEYDDQPYWEAFILNAQLYCLYCCSAGEDLLRSRGAALTQDQLLH
jgi:hypothetical protein